MERVLAVRSATIARQSSSIGHFDTKENTNAHARTSRAPLLWLTHADYITHNAPHFMRASCMQVITELPVRRTSRLANAVNWNLDDPDRSLSTSFPEDRQPLVKNFRRDFRAKPHERNSASASEDTLSTGTFRLFVAQDRLADYGGIVPRRHSQVGAAARIDSPRRYSAWLTEMLTIKSRARLATRIEWSPYLLYIYADR